MARQCGYLTTSSRRVHPGIRRKLTGRRRPAAALCANVSLDPAHASTYCQEAEPRINEPAILSCWCCSADSTRTACLPHPYGMSPLGAGHRSSPGHRCSTPCGAGWLGGAMCYMIVVA